MVGDPVAAVAAVDEDAATEALDLIEVEYEALRTITSIPDAYDNPEPRIHEYGELGNIHRRQVYEFGNVEAGFADADFIREDITFYEGSTHLALEQHASLAQFSHDGKLTLWTSTQDMHYLHRHLAKVLGLPASHIRVIATPNGGGFGGKCDPFNHEIVVSKLAMITRRPVKICLTREEGFYAQRKASRSDVPHNGVQEGRLHYGHAPSHDFRRRGLWRPWRGEHLLYRHTSNDDPQRPSLQV
jgi:CO/xanthine dehydrogenase Mo-binding subunit